MLTNHWTNTAQRRHACAGMREEEGGQPGCTDGGTQPGAKNHRSDCMASCRTIAFTYGK